MVYSCEMINWNRNYEKYLQKMFCPRWGSNSQPPHLSGPILPYKYSALTDCATGASYILALKMIWRKSKQSEIDEWYLNLKLILENQSGHYLYWKISNFICVKQKLLIENFMILNFICVFKRNFIFATCKRTILFFPKTEASLSF